MKKWVLLIVLLIVVTLQGCTQNETFDYDYPTSIIIEKNVNVVGLNPEYEMITLTDQEAIKAFIDELNTWEYTLEKGATLSIDTYDYVISFDEEIIQIVHFKYFYLDSVRTPYLLVEGDIDFIATLNWS
jgi:hypothetical protein